MLRRPSCPNVVFGFGFFSFVVFLAFRFRTVTFSAGPAVLYHSVFFFCRQPTNRSVDGLLFVGGVIDAFFVSSYTGSAAVVRQSKAERSAPAEGVVHEE